jgi:hypothetical protein
MTALPVEVTALLACLRDVEETGPVSWTACCPAHPDSNPSLSITIDGDHILVYDFGRQCPADAIMRAIGKTIRDLFITSEGATGPLTLATFAAAKGFTVDFLARGGRGQKGLIFTYHETGRPRAASTPHRPRATEGPTWTGKRDPPPVWLTSLHRAVGRDSRRPLRAMRSHPRLPDGQVDHGGDADGIPS